MKRMKVICTALCLVLALTVCSGGEKNPAPAEDSSPAAQTEAPARMETPAPTGESQGIQIQPDVQGAGEILAQAMELAGEDYARFAALYRNTPEDVVDADFQNGFSLDQYDRCVCIPVLTAGDYALVDCVYYIVTGTHPNTQMHSEHFTCQFSFMDGAWKLDYSQEAADALNAVSQEECGLYPQGLLDAAEAGRSGVSFNGNYMYLERSAVYAGHSQCEVRFAWQEADGSVSVGLWLANGTEENLCYSAMDLRLTDESLGEILNIQGMLLDVPVPAGTGTLQIINIPADQVRTGSAAWGNVSSHVSVRF